MRFVLPLCLSLYCLFMGSAAMVHFGLAQETAPQQTPESASGTAGAGAANAPQPNPDFPDLTIPAGANLAQLQQLVLTAKKAKPGSPDQYKAQQTAIRDASSAISKLVSKGDPAHKQAEMDTIISSVALLTFFSDKDQAALVQQLTDFLKGRKKLSLQDVQTGMLAAGMLELQPYKVPARDIYQLMDELLKDDEREEMQSLRINLQAAINRLNMLGNKFDFEATTIDGQPIKTDDFAGKFVIVDIFASWCQPCLAEIPHIKAQYEKYADRGLTVVGISLDSDRDALDKLLKDSPLPWPVVHDNAEDPLQRLQLKYGISALPTVLLLNKEGTVVSLEARNAELTRLMQMLFEAPTPAAPAPGESAASDGSPATESSTSDAPATKE